ncbi:MAG TPA: SCO family protein [Gaiellaceae bacterium]|nr:SCO family protein [Gaiellaceae bacterium]
MSAKRLLWMLVLLVGAGAVAGLLALRSSSQASPSVAAPAATWAAGVRPAPAFSLHDQNGRPVSLVAYRGKPVLVTFIDPLCRNYCPLEARVLGDAVARAPAAIVAVSANPYGNAAATLKQDIGKWRLTPAFRWAVGSNAQLSRVWDAYDIQVLVTTKRVAGVRVHEVAHTEAAYLIDANGHERALFVWPYTSATVVRALNSLR